jgi:hypothetical protein
MSLKTILAVTISATWAVLAVPGNALANADVYKALPADTRVVSYSLGDHDGDGQEELAVLYSSDGGIHLTLFKPDSGHWSKWSDVKGPYVLKDGTWPRSMESADANGDGRDEVLTYYVVENNTAMAARILALKNVDLPTPTFEVILQDVTSPAGYPLLETEDGAFSVTFMRMASRTSSGYRRVYCWKGNTFEKCKEVEWKKP